MRILILADLHFDFWSNTSADMERLNKSRDALGKVDAIILAGDITNKPKVRWKYAAQWLESIAPAASTFVFPGNHDYYGHSLDGDARLKDLAQDIGWNWAQQKSIVQDGVRFLCATLWTNLALDNGVINNSPILKSRMNDYRYIRIEKEGYRKARPDDTAIVHNKHIDWLSKELDVAFDGPTAVVTHHVPHRDALAFIDGVHDAAYASDLSKFLDLHKAEKDRYWFYGHAHGGHDVDLPGWSLRMHSLGYPTEGQDIENVLRKYVIDTKEMKEKYNV